MTVQNADPTTAYSVTAGGEAVTFDADVLHNLLGTAGNDTLAGSGHTDIFHFTGTNFGQDSITGFGPEDEIWLTGYAASAISPVVTRTSNHGLQLTVTAGSNSISAALPHGVYKNLIVRDRNGTADTIDWSAVDAGETFTVSNTGNEYYGYGGNDVITVTRDDTVIFGGGVTIR